MVQVICISFVHTNIDQARISSVFQSIGWGTPVRIDIKARQPRPGQKEHNIVFVHFSENIQDQYADNQLEAGQVVKVVYDEPWFWKVRKYFGNTQLRRTESRTAPYVDFGYNSQKPQSQPPIVPKMQFVKHVPQQPVVKEQTQRAWEQTPMGDPIWCQQAAKMMAKMGWEGFGLGVTEQGRLAPVGGSRTQIIGGAGLGFSQPESAYNPVTSLSVNQPNFQDEVTKLKSEEPLIDLSSPVQGETFADLLA